MSSDDETYRRAKWWNMLGSIKATVIAGMLLLVSCSLGSDLPPLPSGPFGPYRLGTDDRVRIITFDEKELTGEFHVNDEGNVAIPLLGAIPAKGLTTADLEQSIRQRLEEKKILLDPSVSVEIIDYRPIFVLGEVNKPGQYPYQPGMTVLTAVAVAGGFTYRAKTGGATILRQIEGKSIEGRVARGMEVLPGDVITIQERYF
jgi:polysaccharide export outer membrane protein